MPKIEKRKGWSDSSSPKFQGGYGEKKEKDYQYSGPKPEKRSGWSDSSVYKYENKNDKYPAKKPFPKRKGWSDEGMPRYEDGGVVQSKDAMKQEARINALKTLEQDMALLGGESLFQRFEDGGIVKAKIDFENDFEDESDDSYDELSRSELIELLRRRR